MDAGLSINSNQSHAQIKEVELSEELYRSLDRFYHTTVTHGYQVSAFGMPRFLPPSLPLTLFFSLSLFPCVRDSPVPTDPTHTRRPPGP